MILKLWKSGTGYTLRPFVIRDSDTGLPQNTGEPLIHSSPQNNTCGRLLKVRYVARVTVRKTRRGFPKEVTFGQRCTGQLACTGGKGSTQ